MSDNPVDYEFIQERIDSESANEVYLVNGVKLEGKIYKQDDISLIMDGKSDRSGKSRKQLLYKNKISTIV